MQPCLSRVRVTLLRIEKLLTLKHSRKVNLVRASFLSFEFFITEMNEKKRQKHLT